MRKAICYLVGAGARYGPLPVPDAASDFVIAVDGGFAYAQQYGMQPDLVIGDFDSLSAPPLDGPDTIVLPKEKDDTDMAAAIGEGWKRGYRRFHIYGGLGNRLDHTLANLQCLADLAVRGGRGYLFERDTVVTAIHDGAIAFPTDAQGVVSVFSHSDIATGVCEKGLKYPLAGATLYNTRPLGISNEFVGTPSSVSVQSGTLILLYPRSAQEAVP